MPLFGDPEITTPKSVPLFGDLEITTPKSVPLFGDPWNNCYLVFRFCKNGNKPEPKFGLVSKTKIILRGLLFFPAEVNGYCGVHFCSRRIAGSTFRIGIESGKDVIF